MAAKQSGQMDKALDLIRAGSTAYAAARQAGVSFNAIYAACRRNGIELKKPEKKPD